MCILDLTEFNRVLISDSQHFGEKGGRKHQGKA